MNTVTRFLIVFCIWLGYTGIYYEYAISPCCGVPNPQTDLVIGFRWNESNPVLGTGFTDLKEKMIQTLAKEKTLLITGIYYKGEEMPKGYPNLGFARAGRVAELFREAIPSEQVELKARLVIPQLNLKDSIFSGYLIEWKEGRDQFVQTIEELDDRIIIRFPYGSAEKEYDPEVDAYLNDLSDKIRESGDRVIITGHADNTGTAAFNMQLSEARANGIKDILFSHGVPSDQLILEARGDKEPIATNETERGRYNNRRVEVRWLRQIN